MSTDQDALIVNKVQRGDTDAFAHLVDRHKDRVYGMLMRMLGDADQAEEMAHETFVRAFRGLDGFRGDAKFATWLVQIAVNLARDHAVARKRNRFVSLDELLEHKPESVIFASSRNDPSQAYDDGEIMDRFETAMEELPPAYREAFVLRHMQGMNYEDMAAATGDSVGSLKVRVHRARKILKNALFADAADMAPNDLD